MKSDALVLGALCFALVAALIVWRVTTGRRETAPNIDVMMDRLAGDAVEEAQEQYSVTLDYSPGSVPKVDAILGRLHARHVQHPLGDRELGRQSRLWGAYLGAVIKRVHPAHWDVDSKVAGKGTLPLVFGPEDQTFPCAWTYKRLVNGDEDNVAVKFQILIMERGKPREGLSPGA